MNRVDDALNYFREGFSCSQAVFAAYAKELGMDERMALKVSQGFGAGMGGMRGECGCATGAYMVISLIHGREEVSDAPARVTTFNLVKEFSKRFQEKFQTTNCGVLLENRSGSHFEMCGDFVREACCILEDLLAEDLR